VLVCLTLELSQLIAVEVGVENTPFFVFYGIPPLDSMLKTSRLAHPHYGIQIEVKHKIKLTNLNFVLKSNTTYSANRRMVFTIPFLVNKFLNPNFQSAMGSRIYSLSSYWIRDSSSLLNSAFSK